MCMVFTLYTLTFQCYVNNIETKFGKIIFVIIIFVKVNIYMTFNSIGNFLQCFMTINPKLSHFDNYQIMMLNFFLYQTLTKILR